VFSGWDSPSRASRVPKTHAWAFVARTEVAVTVCDSAVTNSAVTAFGKVAELRLAPQHTKALMSKVKPLTLEPEIASSIKARSPLSTVAQVVLRVWLSQEFNLNIAIAAEEVIFKRFPEKVGYAGFLSLSPDVILQILALQNLIDDMNTPSSDYSLANPAADPDINVYPPPQSTTLPPTESPSKKRKRDVGESLNGETGPAPRPGTSGAVYSQVVHTNGHIRSIQLRNRKEFGDMISLCVSAAVSWSLFAKMLPSYSFRIKSNCKLS